VSARGKARKKAIDYLYEADQRALNVLELLANRPVTELSEANYVNQLLRGVSEHREKIDELIITYAQGWEMDRMPVIDRNILRLAIYEIIWNPEVDDQVAAAQAIELAQTLSTDESAKYVNGVLGRIIVLKPVISA
jgi:N utilization substance protein B